LTGEIRLMCQEKLVFWRSDKSEVCLGRGVGHRARLRQTMYIWTITATGEASHVDDKTQTDDNR
jgi:hypothetical protein